MRPYPAYKASGVDWLGEVPEGWEVVPVYGLAAERSERNDGMKEDNLLSLSYGNIVQKDIDGLDGLLPESFETYQIVHPGDIVLRLTDLQNDKRSLRSAIVRERGIITSAYLALMPRKGIDSEYLAYLLRSYDQRKIFYSMGGGLRQSMKFADLKRMPVLLPPLPEQRAIAAFLDREVGKIDALVEESRQLIALLAEKRQATISHAVTRGLNPAARLRPSGIDWLGDIPEGWEVVKASRVIHVLSGFAFPSEGFSHDESDTRLLRGVNVAIGNLRWEEAVYWQRSEGDNLDAFEVHEDDLVIGMDRPWISQGLRIALVAEDDLPCLLLQRVGLIRTNETVNPRFLMYQYSQERFKNFLEPDMTGVSVPHISSSQIESFPITLPPREVQDEIVTYLEKVLARLDALTAEANSAISLLLERRAALISAAVTGKIDVRGAAPAPAQERT